MNILLKYHIRKKMKSIHLMKKCWTIYSPPKSPSPIYPKIAKSDLPSNRLYDLPPPEIAKSDLPSNRLWRFTPHPQNRQVRFTLKSPSPIYPQIVCMIYPPPNWFEGKSQLAIWG